MPISVMLAGLSLLFCILASADCCGNNKRAYFFICMVLLLLAYIRNPFIGTDSPNNYEAFMNISNGAQLNYGSGYLLYVKAIQIITTNYRVFLIVTATLILAPVFYILKKHEYRSFAVILYSLSMYSASFDVLKGYLALSFVLLAAYAWIECGWKKRAVMFGIVGFFFHPSILLFVAFLWISRMIIEQKWWILIYLAGAMFMIPQVREAANRTVVIIGGWISSRYADYIFEYYYSTTYVLLYGFASMLLMLSYRRLIAGSVEKGNERSIRFQINMHLIGQWLALFGGFIPSVNRYMKFLLLFSIMLICECIKTNRDSENRIILKMAFWVVYAIFVFLNNGGLVYTIGA